MRITSADPPLRARRNLIVHAQFRSTRLGSRREDIIETAPEFRGRSAILTIASGGSALRLLRALRTHAVAPSPFALVFLHLGDVRIELLLLIRRENRADRGEMRFVLRLHLGALLGDQFVGRRRVALFARFTNRLEIRPFLAALRLHGGTVRLMHRVDLYLLRG